MLCCIKLNPKTQFVEPLLQLRSLLFCENMLLCADGLFKVSPLTPVQQGGCSFTEGTRQEISLKALTGRELRKREFDEKMREGGWRRKEDSGERGKKKML